MSVIHYAVQAGLKHQEHQYIIVFIFKNTEESVLFRIRNYTSFFLYCIIHIYLFSLSMFELCY